MLSAKVLCQSDSISIGFENQLQEKVIIELDGPEVVSESLDSLVINVIVTGVDGSPINELGIVYENQSDNAITINSDRVFTDSTGNACFVFTKFKEGEEYKLVFFTSGTNYLVSPKVFEFRVRSSNWVFMMIIGLLGGLSLFLLGMNMMSNGLQNSAGDQLRYLINKLTNNRFVAVGIGALITTIIQSSSATNVMLVSFVDSRLMRFKQTIGMILGAAIGTTITVQIIAFKITDFALLFVSIGLFIHLVSKKNQYSEIGRGILGFGILFFGMHIMSESMYPMRSFQPFIDVLVHLEKPLIGILVGALFTALIQSSGAFIGILIILSMQRLLSIEASVSLIIGANLGTAITAILASINTTREAKQVALAHTLIKIVGAFIFFFLISRFTQSVEMLSNNSDKIASPREIANAHTIYNVVLTIIFLPITQWVAWVINKILPVTEEEVETLSVKYINESLLEVPSLALKASREELIRMMKETQKMTKLIIKPFFDKTVGFENQIDDSEQKVNFLRDSLTAFLINFTRSNISENSVKEAFILLNAVREFEEIADVISTKMKSKAVSWCNNNYVFSEIGKAEIETFHALTLKIIKKSIQVYQTLDFKQAEKLRERYNGFREEYFEMERSHYLRLQSNIEETITSSKTHLELITLMKVICSHATNTSRIIIAEKPKVKSKKK